MHTKRQKRQHGSIDDLFTEINSLHDDSKCKVIAISGFVGAGKTTTARKLSAGLGDVQIICIDEFIVNHMQDSPHFWDGIDWQRLINEVLIPASGESESIMYGVYDWTENRIVSQRRFPLPKFLIVEGVGLLRPDLMAFFYFSVWLDIPLQVAGARAVKRDKEKYHIESDSYWINSWSVNDREYFERFLPMELADFILSNFSTELAN